MDDQRPLDGSSPSRDGQMEAIRHIFKIGHGPSSSHTMAPRKAAQLFLDRFPRAASFQVTLFGSLAATGKGHLSDRAIREVFGSRQLSIVWEPEITLPFHPNAMRFESRDPSGSALGSWTVYSVGGGDLREEGEARDIHWVYPHGRMAQILEWIDRGGNTFFEYVEAHEGPELFTHLAEVWKAMRSAVARGIEAEGTLPGELRLSRKASSYYLKARNLHGSLRRRGILFAYALAVAEENAAGGQIVTAPTCGSAGVLPAVLLMLSETYQISEIKVHRALATAGLIGALVKHNASISGAEVGCQGEIGTACAMAAGAATQLSGGTPAQIEYAAEMGLEHHLGLTCDPVAGLVQIPCIERNAFAASRALDACGYAMLSDGKHQVSFDRVLRAMKQTGHDLPDIYRETSEGGLAIFASPERSSPSTG